MMGETTIGHYLISPLWRRREVWFFVTDLNTGQTTTTCSSRAMAVRWAERHTPKAERKGVRFDDYRPAFVYCAN